MATRLNPAMLVEELVAVLADALKNPPSLDAQRLQQTTRNLADAIGEMQDQLDDLRREVDALKAGGGKP